MVWNDPGPIYAPGNPEGIAEFHRLEVKSRLTKVLLIGGALWIGWILLRKKK